jgi:hypothetical protein
LIQSCLFVGRSRKSDIRTWEKKAERKRNVSKKN